MNIIFDLHDVLFKCNFSFKELVKNDHLNNPSQYKYSPIEQGISLVKKCHTKVNPDGSRKCKLFLLSNCYNAGIKALEKEFPEIMQLFDGVVISEMVGQFKPSPDIFIHLLEKHNLDPYKCILIDDKNRNILAAQRLGINGILFDNTLTAENKLKELQIL